MIKVEGQVILQCTYSGHVWQRTKLISVSDDMDSLFTADNKELYQILIIDADKEPDFDTITEFVHKYDQRRIAGRQLWQQKVTVFGSQSHQELGLPSSDEGCCGTFYQQKDRDYLADLFTARVRFHEDSERSEIEEALKRRTFLPEQSGVFEGWISVNDKGDQSHKFECPLGRFILRGGNPAAHMNMKGQRVKGKILTQRAPSHIVPDYLQVIDVEEITDEGPYPPGNGVVVFDLAWIGADMSDAEYQANRRAQQWKCWRNRKRS
jgi:hypothetical protein